MYKLPSWGHCLICHFSLLVFSKGSVIKFIKSMVFPKVWFPSPKPDTSYYVWPIRCQEDPTSGSWPNCGSVGWETPEDKAKVDVSQGEGVASVTVQILDLWWRDSIQPQSKRKSCFSAALLWLMYKLLKMCTQLSLCPECSFYNM